jgi:hypothetical protein
VPRARKNASRTHQPASAACRGAGTAHEPGLRPGHRLALFGKWPQLSFQDLARQADTAVRADAGLAPVDAGLIESARFGTCGMGQCGQGGICALVCFTPLVERGLLPERVPTINVEGGCATASFAVHGPVKACAAEAASWRWRSAWKGPSAPTTRRASVRSSPPRSTSSNPSADAATARKPA